MKKLKRLVVSAVILGASSVLIAPPAHACFNPDEPTCQIRQAFCYASEPAAKYRDKFVYC